MYAFDVYVNNKKSLLGVNFKAICCVIYLFVLFTFRFDMHLLLNDTTSIEVDIVIFNAVVVIIFVVVVIAIECFVGFHKCSFTNLLPVAIDISTLAQETIYRQKNKKKTQYLFISLSFLR